MQYVRGAPRAFLLSLTLMSACAASDPSTSSGQAEVAPSGTLGSYLAGRFAMSEGDPATAANDLLRASAQNPGDPELTLQAFMACLRRPARGSEAGAPVARQPGGSACAGRRGHQVRPLAGGGAAVSRPAAPGHDAAAAAAPGGLGAAGDGRDRHRAVHATALRRRSAVPALFALHAAMIADLGNRPGGRQSCTAPRRPTWPSRTCGWRRSWRAGRRAPASRPRPSTPWLRFRRRAGPVDRACRA